MATLPEMITRACLGEPYYLFKIFLLMWKIPMGKSNMSDIMSKERVLKSYV